MYNFRVASRSDEAIKAAQADLDEAFAVLKPKNGEKVNRAGIYKLKETEHEIAEVLIQLLDDQMRLTDPTPMFVDTQTGNFGDKHVFQEVTAGLRVVDRAIGSKPHSQRLAFTEYDMSTQMKEMNVEIPLELVANGRYDAALLTQMMAEAKQRYQVGAILDAVDVGVASVADYAGFNLRYSGLTAANLDDAVDGLMDQGFQPTIFGRWGALVGIRSFAGWATSGSDAALREFETRGLVGSYHGAPIVVAQERYSRRHLSQVIRYDRVYLSANANPRGAIFLSEDVSFLNYSEIDPRNGLLRIGIRWQDGVKVTDQQMFRIIEV